MFSLTTFQIFAGQSNFRGAIKDRAAIIVEELYKFEPEPDLRPEEMFNNQQEKANFISSRIKELLHQGHFLEDGLDEQVSPNIL